MTPQTLLLRQVHPNFIRDGRATSQAFYPTDKDNGFLSVDNGDLITAEDAFIRYTHQQGLRSYGVCAVTCETCRRENLPIIEDGIPYPEHCSIDFNSYSRNQRHSIAKRLLAEANELDWLYQASAERKV